MPARAAAEDRQEPVLEQGWQEPTADDVYRDPAPVRVYREPQPEQGYQEQALGQGWQEPARNEAYQESLLAAQDYIASGIWGDAQGGDEQLPAPPAPLSVLN